MTTAAKRRKPRRTQYDRSPAPIGTVRVRYCEGSKGDKPARHIKVRMDGPPSGRWQLYARYLWETLHGPVPAGYRVGHKDGNTMNDDPRNVVLMKPGDVVGLWHQRDEQGSAANFRKLRKATAQFNRDRAAQRRFYEWLPTRWYATFPAAGQVLNEPRRKRIEVLKLCGVNAHWRVSASAARGYAGRDVLQACLLIVLQINGPQAAAAASAGVNRLRQLAGWQLATSGAIRSAASRLRADGLIDGPLGHYELTPLARDEQTRRSPLIAVRGDRLQRDPLLSRFRKVSQLRQVCRLCGCTESNACYDEFRGACSWIDSDLCTHCSPETTH